MSKNKNHIETLIEQEKWTDARQAIQEELKAAPDNHWLLTRLSTTYYEQGDSVTVAYDGREGLDTARDGGFDVLILDVMLPGLDGFSIVRELRATGDAALLNRGRASTGPPLRRAPEPGCIVGG